MYRLFDFECQLCGRECEALTYVSVADGEEPAGEIMHRCGCADDKETPHTRLISLVGPYMGEKVMNPQIMGGKHDTMGYRSHPVDLPDLPGQAEHQDYLASRLSELPANHTAEDRKAVLRDCQATAPSTADYNELFKRPEYREAERIIDRNKKENASKRKRAAAIAKGENINMRRDKALGDPKI